jgi:hypothetical protein
MLDSNVLDEALIKKNKDIERLTRQIEEQKKNYEIKIKNLMNSIGNLKTQNQEIESTTKDNVRVSIINKLKEERKDQEQVINHLRKLIGDEEKVDKYLLKEFDKKGNSHTPTYEELKIKIKQLEAEIVSLKYKQMTNVKSKTLATEVKVDDDNVLAKQIIKLKEDILQYEEKIQSLTDENTILNNSKDKMEKIQYELFEKMKIYTK